MEGNAWNIGVAGEHVRESHAGVVVMDVPAAWEAFGGCETTFDAVGGLDWDGA